jgi:hypothetical protein
MATLSSNYEKIWRAVRERKRIACVFEGRYREACPIILGYSVDGRERVLVFQIGGKRARDRNCPDGEAFMLRNSAI